MLYKVLKPVIGLALRAYYNEINVIGKENLPESGATLFVSNHPNSFIDPLILVILLKRELHFIAGAEWFGKGIKDWIFRTQFNMIPVKRPWLVEGENVDNEDMFLECYKSLQNGSSILIYPEGSSVTIQKVRELKTGAARIKLGTEEYTDHKVNVSIVPIGLNYSREHRFQSDLTVKVGTPIEFNITQNSNKGKDQETVRKMTDIIQDNLKAQILHIENQDLKPVIKKVIRLFSSTLNREYNISEEDLARDFNIKKEIVNAIDYFDITKPEEIEKMDKQIDSYFGKVDELKLEDKSLEKNVEKGIIPLLMKIILGLPFSILGFVFNYIPYQFTYTYFRMVWLPKMRGDYKQGQLNPSFVSSLAFIFGLLIFVIWYIAILFICILYSGYWWIGVGALFAGYVSGRILLYYMKWIKKISNIIKLKWVVVTENKSFKQLMDERDNLINQLLSYRNLYVNSKID